jgi:replicative DNA helicase
MELKKMTKEYTDENSYAIDCLAAATGTLLDPDYNARNFESMIGFEKSFQKVCSSFILFVKSMGDREQALKYASRENFLDFFTNRKNGEATTEESSVIDLLYSRIQYNKENNNADLKEPGLLTERLMAARKKINLSKTATQILNSDTFKTSPVTWSEKYFEDLQKNLNDALESENDQETGLMFADDIAKFYSDTLDKRENGEYYSFHNKVFDELITEGPTPGHGGIIGGSTGMGKSALCLNVINDCINADAPVIYFPIEMGVENTLDRLASMRTHIPFKTILKLGRQDEIQNAREILDHEILALKAHTNFAIVNDSNINMRKLEMYIKQFQAKLPGRKHCIVFIDLLLLVAEFFDEKDGSMAQMIEKAINKLDLLAKKLGVHWVGVVQLNRTVEQDKVLTEQNIDKLRPTRSSVKNSAALLERARWAITIFRKRYFADLYLDEAEAQKIEDVAEIQLMKANDEQLGRRYMNFDGPTFTMTPRLTKEEQIVEAAMA